MELKAIRQKYKEHGIKNMSDREILGLLISYCNDTQNPMQTADTLLDAFGSLEAVLDVQVQDFDKHVDIDISVSALLALQSDLARFCRAERIKYIQLTQDNCIDVLSTLFIGCTSELFYMISLNEENKIISTDCLSLGILGRATVYTRHAIKLALKHNANKVIFTHNHTNGSPMPSQDDVILTLNLYEALGAINVKLLDHIVIANDEYVSMDSDMQVFKMRIPTQLKTKFTTTYEYI